MSYANNETNMKQRIFVMGLILIVVGGMLYMLLTAEGISPKKDDAAIAGNPIEQINASSLGTAIETPPKPAGAETIAEGE